MKKKITKELVDSIASLAKITVTENEKNSLVEGFNKTLEVIKDLFKVDVSNQKPTYQITGLENVLREDIINDENTFSQENALRNAKKTHNGYFVVNQILSND